MKVAIIRLIQGIAILHLGGFVSVAQTENPMRTWTDESGRQVRAVLEKFQDGGTLILRLEDGRSVPFPVSKLSKADQDYALEMYAARPTITEVDWSAPKQSEDYVVRGVRRENCPGFVSTKSGWEYKIKCIEARLEYKGEEASAPGYVSAYFYDREGRLLEKFDKPPRRQNEDRTYVELPARFEKGKSVEVYYPLTEFLEASDWATVLIVFGSGNEFTAQTMPGTSLEKLDFAEKKHLFPGWDPDAAVGSQPKQMSQAELEIRRVKQVDHPYAVVFNGGYSSNVPCVTAEVRSKGSAPPGQGSVKLYVFDASGRQVASRGGPSSAIAEGGTSQYVANPKIADDSWHPVVFALDRELEDKKHPTYVVVFTFAGATTAYVESSVGATLEKLEFPEKKDLPK